MHANCKNKTISTCLLLNRDASKSRDAVFSLPCAVLKAANRTATEMGCFGSMVLIQFGPLSPAGPFWTRLNPFGKRIGPCGDPEDHHKATADCIWLIGPYLCHIWPITIDVV